MRLAAASDIHAPRNLDRFRDLLENTDPFDGLLLAGDVINDDDIDRYGDVLSTIPDDADVYAVFGNEEYEEHRDDYVARYGDRVRFLRDLALDLDTTRIVGTTGSLDRPTYWQRTNKPERWRIYADRVDRVDRLLRDADRALLLTHYAPTYRTLRGEDKDAWPEMGRKGYEDVIEKHSDTLIAAVHGHAHRGQKRAEVHGVPVINAAVTLDRDALPVVET